MGKSTSSCWSFFYSPENATAKDLFARRRDLSTQILSLPSEAPSTLSAQEFNMLKKQVCQIFKQAYLTSPDHFTKEGVKNAVKTYWRGEPVPLYKPGSKPIEGCEYKRNLYAIRVVALIESHWCNSVTILKQILTTAQNESKSEEFYPSKFARLSKKLPKACEKALTHLEQSQSNKNQSLSKQQTPTQQAFFQLQQTLIALFMQYISIRWSAKKNASSNKTKPEVSETFESKTQSSETTSSSREPSVSNNTPGGSFQIDKTDEINDLTYKLKAWSTLMRTQSICKKRLEYAAQAIDTVKGAGSLKELETNLKTLKDRNRQFGLSFSTNSLNKRLKKAIKLTKRCGM